MLDCCPDTSSYFCRGSLGVNANDSLRISSSQNLETLVDATVKLQVFSLKLVARFYPRQSHFWWKIQPQGEVRLQPAGG